MPASRAVDQTDLKHVRGIGRKVEARLKEAGIADLGQLARTPVNELAAILTGLAGRFDADRILRENWVAQAAALAAPPTGQAETMAPIRHNFTVEVRRVPAAGPIESSRVIHVQTGDQETWRGWDPRQLIAFVEERSGMLPARPEKAGQEAPPVAGSAGGARETGAGRGAGRSLRTFGMVAGSGSDVSLRGPVRATLVFDPTAIGLPADQAVEVQTDVFVRQRPPSKSILVGRSRMQVHAAGPVRCEIPCDLPVAAPPAAMFAAVRVLVTAADAGRSPARGLADACLEIYA